MPKGGLDPQKTPATPSLELWPHTSLLLQNPASMLKSHKFRAFHTGTICICLIWVDVKAHQHPQLNDSTKDTAVRSLYVTTQLPTNDLSIRSWPNVQPSGVWPDSCLGQKSTDAKSESETPQKENDRLILVVQHVSTQNLFEW